MRTRLSAARGFTLVELMAVVAIIAVLATIAVFSYKKIIRRARVAEGAAFLMDIKMKQETHFMTYSKYVNTGTTPDDFYPTSGTDGLAFEPTEGHSDLPVAWGWKCSDANLDPEPAGFCELGITPTSQYTYFQYVTMGWTPGAATPPADYIQDPTRRWWYARAKTYPDATPTFWMELRLSSELVEVVELDLGGS